jgi:hypothetical protein
MEVLFLKKIRETSRAACLGLTTSLRAQALLNEIRGQWVKSVSPAPHSGALYGERPPMSAPHSAPQPASHSEPGSAPNDGAHDVVEEIVPLMPIVLPIVGAVLMFLLAFIAVTMA